MEQGAPAAFFSYSREDSDFALKLAGDLKDAGANVWLDQLDIQPGDRWDRTVEDALTNCPRMVVILSAASVSSTNVMDEVSFALEEQKTVIPVMYRDCTVPFRLRRVQHVDFRQDYARGLQKLLKILALGQEAGQNSSAISDVGSQSRVSDADERGIAVERARLEDERGKSPEQAERKKLESQDESRPSEKVHAAGNVGARSAAESSETMSPQPLPRLPEEHTSSLTTPATESSPVSRVPVAGSIATTKLTVRGNVANLPSRSKVAILIAAFAFALGVLGYYIITAPQRTTEAAQKHYTHAEDLYNQKNLDGALAEYRDAISLQPGGFPEAHSAICFLLRLQGHFDGAIAECREAIKIKPESAEAHYYLGMALLGKQDEEGAKAEFGEVVTSATPGGLYLPTRQELNQKDSPFSFKNSFLLSINLEKAPEERFRVYSFGVTKAQFSEEDTNLERLGSRLNDIFKVRAQRVLWMRTDPSIPFSTVMQILTIVRDAGVDKILIEPPPPPPPA